MSIPADSIQTRIPFRAMILAAGLGSRLRPLTLERPKVLVPVQNRPLLHWLIDYLRGAGAEAVIINAHHLSRALVEHVRSEKFNIPVEVRVEESLLDTGGGIRNVADFSEGRPFVVINGDIFSAIDIQEVLGSHLCSGAKATLVLTDEPRFNQVQVAVDGRILSFTGGPGQRLAFTGIQVLDPQGLMDIPARTPVSIIDFYGQLIAAGSKVMAHVVEGEFWRELGTPERYLQLHQEFFRLKTPPLPGVQVGGKPAVHPSVRLGAGVELEGAVCLGAGSVLGDGVKVHGSILWDRVEVRAGCSVTASIICDRVVVREPVRDAVITGLVGGQAAGRSRF
ncbi:MAG: sugar phosphate nucleotidyltransferase [Syntrophobacteria bacterium]